MIIKYIDANGNRSETEDIVHIPENLHQIDGVWFEKAVEKKSKVKKNEIVIPEAKEEEVEEEQEEEVIDEV